MPISEILDGVWAEGTAIMNHSNATTNVHGAGSNSLEQTGHKNVANGYVGLDATGKIPSTLGAELTANKNVANGYAGLDASGFVPTSEIPYSVIPVGVSVSGLIPYMDDALYLNLVYIPSGHYLAFNDSIECFSLVKQ